MRASGLQKPKLMVISTATPVQSLTDSDSLRPGKTGQIIERLTGAGSYCIGDENAEQAFKGNVENNSWVIVTGHGNERGGFSSLSGTSSKVDESGRLMTVKCDVLALAELIIGNQLKAGDKINVMLFVCNGGEGSKTTQVSPNN